MARRQRPLDTLPHTDQHGKASDTEHAADVADMYRSVLLAGSTDTSSKAESGKAQPGARTCRESRRESARARERERGRERERERD